MRAAPVTRHPMDIFATRGGDQGPPGSEGPPGAGLEIKGSVPRSATCRPTAEPGDVWVVKSFEPDHLFMWDGDSWVDLGEGGGRTFTHNPPDAVTRTITDRMKDTVHLLDYIPTTEHAAIYAGTSTYDASEAMQNAIASVSVDASAVGGAGPEIILPYGRVHFESTLEINKTIQLKGHGTGQSGGRASILEFAADTHGIIVHAINTYDIDKGGPAWGSGTTYVAGDNVYRLTGGVTNVYMCVTPGGGTSTVGPSHTTGDATLADGYTWRLMVLASQGGGASTLRDFFIVSLGGTTGHGLWCRGRVFAHNVRIGAFPEDGLHIWADINPQGETQGNANNCHFSNMRISSNGGNGVFLKGGDVNACMFDHIDSSANWGCGFNDESYLGNTYVMSHTNGNGVGGQVHYAGDRYYVIDPVLASTTVPGTDSAVWGDLPAGGAHPSYPDWVSGNPYVLGNSFRTTSDNSIGVIIGPYTESGQPPTSIAASWIAIGGGVANNVGPAFTITSALGGNGILQNFQVPSPTGSAVDWTTYIGRGIDEAITVKAEGDGSYGLALYWDDTNQCWGFTHNREPTAGTGIRFTTLLSTFTGGRSAAINNGEVIFGQGLWLGNTVVSSRHLTFRSDIPTTGRWAAGDTIFNSAPLLGEPWGWRCIMTGDFAATPPVFQPLRDQGSQQTIATGGAFTLTPGTSPYHTLHTGTMTADRAVTLTTTGALIGLSYKITRTSTGAFNLNVGTGPLKALAANTWCEVAFDGTAYYLAAYGTL